jgi:uncharacterized protein YpmS
MENELITLKVTKEELSRIINSFLDDMQECKANQVPGENNELSNDEIKALTESVDNFIQTTKEQGFEIHYSTGLEGYIVD